MIYQIIQKNEQKEKSKPCSHDNDLKYDNCVYGALRSELEEQLGCSFEFFQRNESPSNKKMTNECRIKDVKQKTPIKDVVYGNSTFAVILLEYWNHNSSKVILFIDNPI